MRTMQQRKAVSAAIRSILKANKRLCFDEALMYGLTMTLKNEIVKIAPKGRVNSVGPGWVLTALAEQSLNNPRIAYQALGS